MKNQRELIVIGGGLAGTEAAWQAAQCGILTCLYEMRPQRQTPAHVTDHLAELVCSNSLGSDLPGKAPSLLKTEIRRFDSLIMQAAAEAAVPAGGALAVDRDKFAQNVTKRIETHPLIEVRREEVTKIPDTPTLIATHPPSLPPARSPRMCWRERLRPYRARSIFIFTMPYRRLWR